LIAIYYIICASSKPKSTIEKSGFDGAVPTSSLSPHEVRYVLIADIQGTAKSFL
jgi:hypothetical protein